MADAASNHHRLDALVRRQRKGHGHGVAEALDRLCRAACEELALLGAAATLMSSVGAHAVSAASSKVTRRLEEAQFGVGEGPTRDAFELRRPVLVPDLENGGGSRWPAWVPEALRAGATGVYAVPLQVGASTFGALTMYGGSAPLLDRRALESILMFGELATAILLDGSGSRDGQPLDPGLGDTLETHANVYQAQGMVMVALGVSLPEALARMRANAWANGQDLETLAGEIVAGRAMPTSDDH